MPIPLCHTVQWLRLSGKNSSLAVLACKALITCVIVHCSRAANEEAQLRNQRGSDIFAEPDALQTREVNHRKLQVTSELYSCLP